MIKVQDVGRVDALISIPREGIELLMTEVAKKSDQCNVMHPDGLIAYIAWTEVVEHLENIVVALDHMNEE